MQREGQEALGPWPAGTLRNRNTAKDSYVLLCPGNVVLLRQDTRSQTHAAVVTHQNKPGHQGSANLCEQADSNYFRFEDHEIYNSCRLWDIVAGLVLSSNPSSQSDVHREVLFYLVNEPHHNIMSRVALK